MNTDPEKVRRDDGDEHGSSVERSGRHPAADPQQHRQVEDLEQQERDAVEEIRPRHAVDPCAEAVNPAGRIRARLSAWTRPLHARRNAARPGYRALAPRALSMRRSWLYFAVRSVRESDPVLICPVFAATAMSAMVVSSVSPERCETIDV